MGSEGLACRRNGSWNEHTHMYGELYSDFIWKRAGAELAYSVEGTFLQPQ